MESREALLDKLKSAPDVLLLIKELQQNIAAEAKERQKFYDLVHEDHKAEFINGEIVFHSPVKRQHWLVSMQLSSQLHQHVKKRALGEVGVEKVMIRLTRNDYEPDICFFTKEKAKDFTPGQMLFPAPDFVVEITSPSTEKIDREEKFIDYAAHGIPEYWIIDPEKQTLEQYALEGRSYQLQQKLSRKGMVESLVIKDFEVDLATIFD